MTIYSVDNQVLHEAPITKDALIKFALMGDYYIELPFVTASQIKFPRGSYIIHENRRFEIMDRVRPDFDAKTGGYKYALKFWSQQNHMKRRKVFWLSGAAPEATFNNTTTLDQFGQLIVDNMNTFLGGENWVLGGIPADLADTSKLISFNGDFCWDAVNTIAEIFGVEWWTEENGAQVALYFGKLEFGTPEEFKRGDVVTSIPASKGDDSSYGTRFYVFGSTRNLPKDYNNTEQGGVTNHVSEVRLQLPEGIPYIDAKENLAPQDIVEQVVFFEDVFPKNTDVVTAVTTVERAVEGAEEDQQNTFTAYQVVAENTPFVPSDVYEGETLMIRFESGSLSGMEFEVDLRDDNDNRIDPATWKPEDGFNKKFEIVATTEYSGDSLITIPGGSLIPAAEDKFILTGVKLAQERITEAENELLNVGQAYAAKNSSDTEVYNCPSNPVYCATNDKNYEAGQKVALVDSRFEDGVRYSRIQGYEKKLWNPYIATYTVGDNSAYTRIGQIETSIQESAYAERIGVVKGVGIYVIRSKYDQTSPTDYNVYSALAVEALFLNKTKDQIVHGNVEFKKPVVGTLQSKNYRAGGFAGAGFKLGYDANGDSIIEADNLVIRKEAKFSTVTINQISFTFGETVFSNGGAEITAVEELDDRYRCYYNTEGGTRYAGIKEDDQVRCQYYSADLSKAKYYWRLCVGVSNEDGYFDLSKTDKNGNGIPEVGDNAVQFGNRTDKRRQSAIVIDPLNGGSVWVYANINSYDLKNNLFVGIGTIADSQQAFLYGYGAAYIGDRDEASYISYDPDTKTVKIKGALIVGSGSSGLANFSEWASKQSQIDTANTNATNAQKTANEAKKSAANALSEAKKYADAIKDELQDQLDGKVESFFKNYDPTLENEPASSWITDELKEAHLNDTFTNTETGKSWRWLFKNGAYQWVPIADTQAAEALAAAKKAQDTADGKRRTFVETPKGPYDVGDLWITGEQIKVCGTASKVSGVYDPDDWEDADNYYKKIEEARQAANEYSDQKSSETEQNANAYTDDQINNVNTNISAIESDLGDAKTDLEKAKEDLEKAKTDLEDVYTKAQADGKISEAELRAIEQAKEEVSAKYEEYIAEAESIATEKINNFIDGQYTEEILALQGQVDGKAETYYQDTPPSNSWDPNTYSQHVGDLWCNSNTGEIKSWDGVEWVSTTAEVPQAVFDKIDGKSSIYVLIPSTYFDDDMWVLEKDYSEYKTGFKKGVIVFANKDGEKKNTENLSLYPWADWERKVSYTDDTTAENALEKAEEAKSDAATAKANAESAQTVANDAAARMESWVADNKITQLEKASINQEYVFVEQDYASIKAQADQYGVGTNEFYNAYYYYRGVLSSIIASLKDGVDAIDVPASFETYQSAYYEKRKTVLEDIAKEAKAKYEAAQKAADEAKDAAAAAQQAAEAAQQAANDAKGVADAAQERMNGWVADNKITKIEKQAIKNELAFIEQDFASIREQAVAYGKESIATTMAPSYVDYQRVLTEIVNNTDEVMDIPGGFADAQSAYYAARTTALQEIAELAKSLIDAVDKKVSDFDYLKKALPSGAETTIGAGVVLSSVLGVQDAGGNVVAAMIDPKSITDQTDVPYFAAGIGDVKNIATTSKTMISEDGEIQLQNTNAAASSRRKVKLNSGFMKFLLGDNVSLEQTPDEYTASPLEDMAFGSFTSEEKSDVTIGLPASFSPFITTKTETFLVKAFDVGEKFTSITVAGGSSTGPLVRNFSGRTYTVKFRLTNESGSYVDGTSKIVSPTGSSTLGVSMYGMYVSGTSANIAKFKNQRVRLELIVTTDETPSGSVDLSVTFADVTNKIVIAGNVTTSAYANRLFGNGFFFAKSETQYAGLIVDAENGPVAEFKNGNQGFRFTNAGLKRWHTTLGWIPIDGVIMRGKIVTLGGRENQQSKYSSWYRDYDSSSPTRSPFSFSTAAPYTVSVALPNSISSNTSFTADDYMVQLTGLRRTTSGTSLSYDGTSAIFASVYAQSKTTFSVYTGDDDTQNSGGFYFEVKVID